MGRVILYGLIIIAILIIIGMFVAFIVNNTAQTVIK